MNDLWMHVRTKLKINLRATKERIFILQRLEVAQQQLKKNKNNNGIFSCNKFPSGVAVTKQGEEKNTIY